jgi:hypothetical protein
MIMPIAANVVRMRRRLLTNRDGESRGRDPDSSRSSSSASFTSGHVLAASIEVLAQASRDQPSSSGGVLEEIPLGGGGSFSTMAARVETRDSPRNARWPVIIS